MSRGDLLSSAAPRAISFDPLALRAEAFVDPRSPFEAMFEATRRLLGWSEPEPERLAREIARVCLPGGIRRGDAILATFDVEPVTVRVDRERRSVQAVVTLPPGDPMIEIDSLVVTRADLEPFRFTSDALLDEINATLRERGLGPRGARGRARR